MCELAHSTASTRLGALCLCQACACLFRWYTHPNIHAGPQNANARSHLQHCDCTWRRVAGAGSCLAEMSTFVWHNNSMFASFRICIIIINNNEYIRATWKILQFAVGDYLQVYTIYIIVYAIWLVGCVCYLRSGTYGTRCCYRNLYLWTRTPTRTDWGRTMFWRASDILVDVTIVGMAFDMHCLLYSRNTAIYECVFPV